MVRTGFEPATYGFQIRRSNHSATLPPYSRNTLPTRTLKSELSFLTSSGERRQFSFAKLRISPSGLTLSKCLKSILSNTIMLANGQLCCLFLCSTLMFFTVVLQFRLSQCRISFPVLLDQQFCHESVFPVNQGD